MTAPVPGKLDAAVKRLLKPRAERVWRRARRMLVTDHGKGVTEPWVPYLEQFAIWKALEVYQFLFVLKVRQIGASTAVLLDDLLWCIMNDTAGQRVKCGLFIDTDAKAKEQHSRACAMLDDIGAVYKPSGRDIIFPNGTMMHFVTAGGQRAGASFSFQRLHLTELPFWRDATNSFSSIMQTLGREGQCVIETTMGLDDPIAMTLWQKQNQFKKLFFSFEDHIQYRAPSDDHPDFPMTVDEEKWLREEGFTNTLAMRYWLWLLRNKNGNDVHKNFREYPQRPEHSFMHAEGRWCKHDPVVVDPLEEIPLEDIPGAIEIFRQPNDCSHHCFIGVDTAGGRGLDRSVAVVVDGIDNRIVASYVSADVRIFEHARVVQRLQKLYTVRRIDGDRKKNFKPLVLVEDNAIGQGIVEELERLRVKFHAFSTSEAKKQQFMELTVKHIVRGECYGPNDLLIESRDARVKNGKFYGLKDLFMSCGFCYDWLRSTPYRDLKPPRLGGRVSIADMRKRRR